MSLLSRIKKLFSGGSEPAPSAAPAASSSPSPAPSGRSEGAPRG